MTANTRIALLRGTYRDELDDEVDAWDVAAEDEAQRPEVLTRPGGIAATLIERTRVVFDPSTGEPRTIRTVVIRHPALIKPLATDRVLDLRTGRRYAITGAAVESRSIAGGRTVRYEAKRVDGE